VRVLVTGASGQLGRELIAVLGRRAEGRRPSSPLEVIGLSRPRLELTDRDAVLGALTSLEPDVVIHAAAATAVDRCERAPELAWSVNALGTRYVAEGAQLAGALLCYVSSDYVFSGELGRAYHEWDVPAPRSVYGRSKLAGEHECGERATIVRTAWVAGRYGDNIVRTLLKSERGAPLRFVVDQIGSPTLASDLAEVVVELAIGRRRGTFHVTNSGEASWFELARLVLSRRDGKAASLTGISTDELVPARDAPRPAYSVLDNAVLRLEGHAPMRPWQEAFACLVDELLE
jgi:dTDP-4-dehydrorhamnose reductase